MIRQTELSGSEQPLSPFLMPQLFVFNILFVRVLRLKLFNQFPSRPRSQWNDRRVSYGEPGSGGFLSQIDIEDLGTLLCVEVLI